MSRLRGAGTALLLGTALLAGCVARPAASASGDDSAVTTTASTGQVVEAACQPVAGLLSMGASMEGHAGRFALALHATSGPMNGATSHAILQLQRSSRPPAGTVTYPLIGTTDVRVAEVGGSMPGVATSRDAARPGVLVLEYPRAAGPTGARDVTVRLGNDANGATLAEQPFDGAYMALHVRHIDAAGFAGQWSSGLEGRVAGGHFCARRLPNQAQAAHAYPTTGRKKLRS